MELDDANGPYGPSIPYGLLNMEYAKFTKCPTDTGSVGKPSIPGPGMVDRRAKPRGAAKNTPLGKHTQQHTKN